MKTLISLNQLEKGTPNSILMSDDFGVIKFMDASTLSSGWALNGNTEGVEKYFGTNDNFDIPIYTNGSYIGVFTKLGSLGIGIPSNQISAAFHIRGQFGATHTLRVQNNNVDNLLQLFSDGGFIAGYTTTTTTTNQFNIGDNSIFRINARVRPRFYLTDQFTATDFFKIIPTATQEPILSSNGLLSIYASTGGTVYTRYNETANGIGVCIQVPTARFHIVGSSAVLADSVFKLENSVATNIFDVRNNGHTLINGLTVGKGPNQILQNTAYGVTSLSVATGIENTAIGYQSLRDNTTGVTNTGVGNNTLLLNTTGSQNVAIGYNAGRGITADNNTAVGFYTLFNATSCSNNTAIGDRSQYSITSGSQNTSIGRFSLYLNQTGQHNVAIGHNALNVNTESRSVVIGSAAAANSTLSQQLAIVGTDAFADLLTGSQNTGIGYNTGRGITTGANNTIIGAQITGLTSSLSNSILIANSAGVVSWYTNSSGNTMIGNGFVSASARLHVVGIDATSSNYSFIAQNSTSGNMLRVRNDGVILMEALPTSSAGLPSGALWKNGTVINIV